jgi:hypothetical protein
MRMKQHMSSHVGDVKEKMFQQAADSVLPVLTDLIDRLEGTVNRKTRDIVKQLRNIFESLILDKGVFKVFAEIREETRAILLNADAGFQHLYPEEGTDVTNGVSAGISAMSVDAEPVSGDVGVNCD